MKSKKEILNKIKKKEKEKANNTSKSINTNGLLPSTLNLNWRANYYLILRKDEKEKDLNGLLTDWNSAHPKRYMSYPTLSETIKGKHISTQISLYDLCAFLKIDQPHTLYFEHFSKQALAYEHNLVIDLLNQLYKLGRQHIYEHQREAIGTLACAEATFGLTKTAFEKFALLQSLIDIPTLYDQESEQLLQDFEDIEYIIPINSSYWLNEEAIQKFSTKSILEIKDEKFHNFIVHISEKWQEILESFDQPTLTELKSRFSIYDMWGSDISCKAAMRELESKAIHNMFTLIGNTSLNYKNLTQAKKLLHTDIRNVYSKDPIEDIITLINKNWPDKI